MKTKTVRRIKAKCSACGKVKWVCPGHVVYECAKCGGCDVAKVKGPVEVRR
jgi:hypothetical protein